HARGPYVSAGRTRQAVGAAVVRLGPQSAAETLCHLLPVTDGTDRRSVRATSVKPSPDHSFELFGRSCSHLIFAGRHKGPWPLGACVRWQPAFIVEVEGQKILRLMDLNQASFPGNPLMPIF